jgi:hypothetical protein
MTEWSQSMPNTSVETKITRTAGNWRHREKRASTKYVAKRVSADDHELLTAYADRMNTSVAELLAPAVQDLLNQARALHVGAS